LLFTVLIKYTIKKRFCAFSVHIQSGAQLSISDDITEVQAASTKDELGICVLVFRAVPGIAITECRSYHRKGNNLTCNYNCNGFTIYSIPFKI